MASIKQLAKRTAQGVGAIFALSVLALAIAGGEAREARKEAKEVEEFVSSAPIYKKGTFGDSLNQLGKMMGVDVPLVFLDTDDMDDYESDFVSDPRALAVATTAKAFALSSNQGRSEREEKLGLKVLAFVPQQSSIHALGACPVFITSALKKLPEASQVATLMHEMTHCEDFYLRRTAPAGHESTYSQIMNLVPQNEQIGMSNAISTAFAESLPTAMLRALSFSSDADIRHYAQVGFADEIRTARSGSAANETPAVAEAMTLICAKAGDCPMKLWPLQKLLVKDPRYMAAMQADIQRLHTIRAGKTL